MGFSTVRDTGHLQDCIVYVEACSSCNNVCLIQTVLHKMIMNWKGCERELLWYNLRYSPSFCREGLRKTTKNLSESRWPLDQHLNQRP
jgi:hypothetical protein